MKANLAARPGPGEPFVMRPSVTQTGRLLGVAFVGAIAYAGLRLIRVWQDPSERWFVVILAATLGVVFAGYLVYFGRARIEVDHERIVKVNAFGGRREFRLDEVGGVALRTLRVPTRAGYPIYGVVYGHDHHGLFIFSERLWNPADVRHLAVILGGADDQNPPVVSIREFDREFPGAFNFWERHPYIFGVLLTLVILVAVVVVITLTR